MKNEFAIQYMCKACVCACNACMHAWMKSSNGKVIMQGCSEADRKAKAPPSPAIVAAMATVISIKHHRAATTKSKVWKANYDGLIIQLACANSQYSLFFSVVQCHCTLGLYDATPLMHTSVYIHFALYFVQAHILSTHTHFYPYCFAFFHIHYYRGCERIRIHIFFLLFVLSPYRLAKWMLSYSYQEHNDVIYDCVCISRVSMQCCDV